MYVCMYVCMYVWFISLFGGDDADDVDDDYDADDSNNYDYHDDYGLHRDCLRFALSHCPLECVKNRQRILISLIPIEVMILSIVIVVHDRIFD